MNISEVTDQFNYKLVDFGVSQTTEYGREGFIEALMLRSGYNPIYPVNTGNTIGDWTANLATFTATANTTDVRALVPTQTNNVLLLTASPVGDGSEYVDVTDIHADGSAPNGITKIAGVPTPWQDWRDSDYVHFWLAANAASDFDAAGELRFALRFIRGGEVVESSLAQVQAAVNNVHQLADIYLPDLIDSRADLSKVVGFRFYNYNAADSQGVEIGGVCRSKFSNGRGPVMGPCTYGSIGAAASVPQGALVQVNPGVAGLAFTEEAAADVADICGPVVSRSATGLANGTVRVWVQTDGHLFLRLNETVAAGDLLIWHSDNATHSHLVEEADTNGEQFGFAVALEAGAQFDDVLCVMKHGSDIANGS